MIREAGAQVWVDKGRTCASSCVLLLASGVQRNLVPGGRVLIHRPYLDPNKMAALTHVEAMAIYAAIERDLRGYFQEMGVDQALATEMMRVPSQNSRQLSEDEATRLGLLGEDAAYAEWDRARAIRRRGKAAV